MYRSSLLNQQQTSRRWPDASKPPVSMVPLRQALWLLDWDFNLSPIPQPLYRKTGVLLSRLSP